MKKFFYKTVPFLPVHDLNATIEFYTHVLGFTDAWFWGDPPTDAGCHRDELSLLFNYNPAMAKKIGGFELVMFVDDVDGIYNEFRGKPQIKFTAPIKDEPWGIREFTIRDLNGYFLRISCSIERINKHLRGETKKHQRARAG